MCKVLSSNNMLKATTGKLFKNRLIWFMAGLAVVIIAAVAAFVSLRPASAAGNIDWFNYGTLDFEGKTYVLQKRDFGGDKGAGYPFVSPYDDHMGYGEQDSGLMASTNTQSVIYAPPGTPICIDKNNKQFFHEYLRFNVTGTDVNANFSKGTYFKVNENDKDTNGTLNCTFANGVDATSNNAANRRIWFFKEGNKVYSFDKAVSFTQGGKGPGGVDLYFRDGDPVAAVNGVTCKDMLVDTGGGKWIAFPMGPAPEIGNTFSPARNAVSESYDAYTSSGGRANANCRLNSIELRSGFMSGVIAHTGVLGKNKDVACPSNIPGSANFDGEEGKKDYFVVACRDGSGDRKIIDYVVMDGNAVRYHDADFTISGGDDGYILVKGVSDRVPKAVPDIGAGVVNKPGTATSGSADTRPICALGDYVGWLLCGAAQLADSIITVVQDIIISFLEVNPINTSGGDPLFRIWQVSVNIANIGFVIAFLAVLFLQATSSNSNYGIKRMLPKLIAAAVISNISIYVAAWGIDLFNIGTIGLRAVIEGIMGDAGISITGLEVPAGTGAPEKILLTGLGGGIFTFLIKAKGIEAIILPMLLGVLVVIVAIAALVLRWVILGALAAGSAVIAILYVIPGTENTGKKMTKLFIQVGAMGPLVVLVFATGHLVSGFIIAVVPTEANPLVRAFLVGIGLTAKWLVLGLIPFMFGASGFIMGWLYKAGSGLAQRANQGMQNSRGMRLRQESRDAAKTKAYLDRLTGVRGGPRAAIERFARRASMSRVLGGSADAQRELEERLYTQRQKLDSEKIQGLQKRLTRSAAIALASGKLYDAQAGVVYDDEGKVTLTLGQEDKNAVEYAQTTGMASGVLGAKALGSFLASRDDMTISMAQNLIKMGGNQAEYEQINDALNAANLESKNPHLGYNQVTADGRMILGGLKSKLGPAAETTDPKVVATAGLRNILAGKTLGDLPKEAYSSDAYDQDAIRDIILERYGTGNEARAAFLAEQVAPIKDAQRRIAIGKIIGAIKDKDVKSEYIYSDGKYYQAAKDASGNIITDASGGMVKGAEVTATEAVDLSALDKAVRDANVYRRSESVSDPKAYKPPNPNG